MTRWVSLGALLLLAGCGAGADPSTTMHGDVSFSTEERVAIEKGNTWLAEQIGAEPLEIVWDLPHRSFFDAANLPPRSLLRWDEGVVYGLYEHGSIYLPGRYGELDTLETVAAHEFGHARRLMHHDGPGIMNAVVDRGTPVWTSEDQAACVEAGICEK